jgi:cytochrome c553
MKNNLRSALGAFALLAALPVSVAVAAAEGADTLRVAGWAATCANCHGTQGRAVEGSSVPGLAGQPSAYLAELLRAYRRGERSPTVMHQIARGYSEAQIDAIAAYFAAVPRQP